MPPQRPDLVLPAHIPDVELDILVGDRLDVEADRRDRRDILVEFELVEDCCARQPRGPQMLARAVRRGLLVLPAASKPSISNRISFDPKILLIILEICPPIFAVTQLRRNLSRPWRKCVGSFSSVKKLKRIT